MRVAILTGVQCRQECLFGCASNSATVEVGAWGCAVLVGQKVAKDVLGRQFIVSIMEMDFYSD